MGNDLVLILVVMEDTLRERNKSSFGKITEVLILVVMEDTLRVMLYQLLISRAALS